MTTAGAGNVDDVDCLVVGSGFGGSVVACRLAQQGRSVLVLERGRPYPPGSFPRTALGSSTNLWDPSEGLFGLFDIWSFRSFEAVVASGLGGGSLIYANVLLRRPPEWFDGRAADDEWPVTSTDLDGPYTQAEQVLKPTPYPYVESTPKTREFRDAAGRAGLRWQAAPLAVSFSAPGQHPGMPLGVPADNLHGVPRSTCRLCGECDVGCNTGSKNTTDLTYLSRAQAAGADIRHLHEVQRIAVRTDGRRGYEVTAAEHHPPDPAWNRVGTSRPATVRTFRARTLVLAAGSLGSTYLLLRNRVNLPGLSPRLGSRFSGNGDYLGFTSSGRTRVLDPTRGPVITSYVAGSRTDDRFVVQDGGHPVIADWLSEVLGLRPLRRVGGVGVQLARARLTKSPRTRVSAHLSRALGTAERSRGLLPMLGMGEDTAGGHMTLRDGALAISWSGQDSRHVFDRIRATMDTVAEEMDGRFRQGPSSVLSRMVTVHPLGGAPMGTDPSRGVVDSRGEVWGYEGLFVADGAVLPGPVGVNPALTIAALAELFCERIAQRADPAKS
ncbi:GMC oxidoreductase [Kineococcus sp. SYSU DK001]|uniref:GMC oxidoreductase n=1 Tax=Kineococcus sp. SYSU DK001 TaxID=3383122 RepID=UPI003D7CA913